MNLSLYRNTNPYEGAAYKNIPMAWLVETRDYFRAQDLKIRVRYRGPRNNPRDNRSSINRQQDCAKEFADRFSVYFC